MIDVRKDFPMLLNNPSLVYLDSACTSLKPTQVIEAEAEYYKKLGACGGRSSHKFGIQTSNKIDESREMVAGFIGANSDGLIWTKNATEGLNLVANALDFSKRKKVVTTVMEHHSVLLPFMRLRDEGKIKLEILNCDSNGEVSKQQWQSAVGKETALVVTNSSTNTLGKQQDVAAIAKIAHDNGALICVDGAQGVPHHKTDFRKDNVDFLAFSGHKMLGPTGIGALAVKPELLKSMKTFMTGGGTVKTVALDKIVEVQDVSRFEPGIQHYSGIIGFATACEYLKKLGIDKIEQHEKELGKKMIVKLEEVGAVIYGSKENRGATVAFSLSNAKAHDVALLLDREGVAVRSGFFCAQLAIEALGAKNGAVRASGYVYNSLDDVEKFGAALEKIKKVF